MLYCSGFLTHNMHVTPWLCTFVLNIVLLLHLQTPVSGGEALGCSLLLKVRGFKASFFSNYWGFVVESLLFLWLKSMQGIHFYNYYCILYWCIRNCTFMGCDLFVDKWKWINQLYNRLRCISLTVMLYWGSGSVTSYPAKMAVIMELQCRL